MKNSIVIIITILYSLIINITLAAEVNGRIILFSQDQNYHSVKLQVNSDINNAKMGGATFVINYDPNFVVFPNEPINGINYTFLNFTGGVYDTATVTNVFRNQIWINISLDSDGNGTQLEGPENWTDLVTIQFEKLKPIITDVVYWNFKSTYWNVYKSDNTTTLQVGNFNNRAINSNADNNTTTIEQYKLSQNYPNPFNPTTKITYQIPATSFVSIKIYDASGSEIATLVNEEKPTGGYKVDWDGTSLPSGVYFYRLRAGSFIETKKMILMK